MNNKFQSCYEYLRSLRTLREIVFNLTFFFHASPQSNVAKVAENMIARILEFILTPSFHFLGAGSYQSPNHTVDL